MKHPFLLLLFGGLITLAPVLRADDATTTAPASGTAISSGTATDGQQEARREKLKEAFAQLDLTDAQKAQIKQIRAATPAGKERRQQIMAVLTPDQKAKLIAMLKERRDGDQ
jgi:Spy/CpxP family protein refolding chaperone